MNKVVICITNDIKHDRRIIRCAESLSARYNVIIFYRALFDNRTDFDQFKTKAIKCIFIKGFWFYFEYNIRLFFKLLFAKTDCIVAVDYDTVIAVRLAGKLRSKKIGFDAHEYFEESIEIVRRPKIQRFWTSIGKRNIKKFDFGYTVSNTIAEIYSKAHNINFNVVRNISSKDKNAVLNYQPEKGIILYQGVLNEGRKLELLIRSSEFLDKDFEIWIIGEGDLSKQLEALSKSINSNCKIIFYSWIPPQELVKYTSQAMIAYNLLDSSSKSYFYSLANKFFDYINSGIPSLNSPFPEYEYLNEKYDCCFTKDFDSPEELAHWFKNTKNNSDLLLIKHHNANKAAEELNWETESSKLLDIYTSNL